MLGNKYAYNLRVCAFAEQKKLPFGVNPVFDLANDELVSIADVALRVSVNNLKKKISLLFLNSIADVRPYRALKPSVSMLSIGTLFDHESSDPSTSGTKIWILNSP